MQITCTFTTIDEAREWADFMSREAQPAPVTMPVPAPAAQPRTVQAPRPQTIPTPTAPTPASGVRAPEPMPTTAAPQPARTSTPDPVPVATVTPQYTAADIQRAMGDALTAGKLDAAAIQGLVSAYGVQFFTEIPPKDYPDLVQRLKRMGVAV